MFLERATASSRVFRALLLAGLIVRAAGLPLRGTVDMDVWKLWAYAGSINVTTMYGVGGNPPERAVARLGHRRGTVDYPPATLFALAVVGARLPRDRSVVHRTASGSQSRSSSLSSSATSCSAWRSGS